MKQAEEKVFFHTPYIICDDWMLQQLQEVCSQVDQVCMMTNSVANNGNPFGAMDYQRYKGKILDTGVQILEYDGGVSYHGKCFAIDDRIASIGSFNWDMTVSYTHLDVYKRQVTVNGIKSGRSCSDETAGKIAKALGVDVTEIIE